MPENGSVRLSVTIRADQKAFLDAHPEFSASGILQGAIDRLRRRIEFVKARRREKR